MHCHASAAVRSIRHLLALVGIVSLLASPAVAQQANDAETGPDSGEQQAIGQLVRLRMPLTGSADRLYQGVLQRAVDRLSDQAKSQPQQGRPTLVIEFSGDGAGSEFERSLALARFLVSDQFAGVRTVAYVPETLQGHAVLAAMACEEIAMAADIDLGEAGIDENAKQPIGQGIIGSYRQIAESRGNVPSALAQGFVDPSVEVYQVETADRIEFVLGSELEALEERTPIVRQEILAPAGSLALVSGRQGRELGFVRYLASDRESLARSLRLPVESLEEDQSLVADWRPVMIDLEGPLTPRLIRQTETLIGNELTSQRVNWIGLRIDSSGGDLSDCLRLASVLAELDGTEVRTVAYVPRNATGGAALVAMACDQIVMQPEARLGGGITLRKEGPPAKDGDNRQLKPPGPDFNPPIPGAADPLSNELSREELDTLQLSLQGTLSEETPFTWSLLAALLDPEIEVYRFTHQETGVQRFYSVKEREQQPDAELWRQGEPITKPGEPLALNAEQASELGVAWQVVERFDDLKQLYGFTEEIRVARLSWAQQLVEQLASPQLSVMLLMIGFVGIYIELNTPGTGVGGFVATLAFLLFFWSKFTAQTAGWLEVMLFVVGLFFILLEVLVLPGFGIFGFGGGCLVLISLVLASQTFILPQTNSQLTELRSSLSVVAGAMALFIIAGMILRQYLPKSPLFRKILLFPPEAHELAELEQRESLADFAHLLGQQGTTTTDLLPAGKALLDGELIDVIAEGEVIDRGATIEVVSVRGSRVAVRQVRT